MNLKRHGVFLPLLALLFTLPVRGAELKTRHVIFVTTDGFRWQELFRGAEQQLMNKANGGVPGEAVLREEFGRRRPRLGGRGSCRLSEARWPRTASFSATATRAARQA